MRRAGLVGGCLAALLVAGCTGGGDDGNDATLPGADEPEAGAEARQEEWGTRVFPLVQRAAHNASALPDGRVLISGGCVVDGCGEATASTELFDPARRRFVAGPPMATPRDGHTATVLADGRVLVTGGWSGEGLPTLSTAEVFDPRSETFAPAGELGTRRGGHAAAPLGDGRVLVAGGDDGTQLLASAEIWDPATGSFTPTGAMSVPRDALIATPLPDGRVLVIGGRTQGTTPLASTEVYDPRTGTWSAGPPLRQARFKHAAAVAGGEVYVFGGTQDDQALLGTVERYGAGGFEPAGTLRESRYKFTDSLAVLPNGKVLIAGGGRTAELYDPRTGTTQEVPGLFGSRASFSTATPLPDGNVLVVGGYDDAIDLRRSAELVMP